MEKGLKNGLKFYFSITQIATTISFMIVMKQACVILQQFSVVVKVKVFNTNLGKPGSKLVQTKQSSL